jgi:chemotaxis protein MotB
MTESGYSNWELSADRANASRRELVRGGLADAKVLRVVGLAAANHLDPKDPFNPVNRRISILVMNKRTEEAVLRDGGSGSNSLDVPADVDGAVKAVASAMGAGVAAPVERGAAAAAAAGRSPVAAPQPAAAK